MTDLGTSTGRSRTEVHPPPTRIGRDPSVTPTEQDSLHFIELRHEISEGKFPTRAKFLRHINAGAAIYVRAVAEGSLGTMSDQQVSLYSTYHEAAEKSDKDESIRYVCEYHAQAEDLKGSKYPEFQDSCEQAASNWRAFAEQIAPAKQS